MRLLLIVFILCVCSSIASAYTFVFKNGKTIEGTIQYEDSATIRITDKSGVAMTLKRSSLNWDATQAANPVIIEVPKAEIAEQEIILVPVRVDRPISMPWKPEIHSEKYWRDRAAKAKKDYARFQADCRSAGGSRTGYEKLQTRNYVVNGKNVKVTGYWADPENIQSANALCREAMKAQADLIEATNELASIRDENETSAVSVSSGVSGSNK